MNENNNKEFLDYCPNCGKEIYEEGWRLDDGPCLDNKFYCLNKGCLCGCKGKKEKENE